jgi:hypothetical protein
MTVVKSDKGTEMLQRPDGRKGIIISKIYYEKLRLFMLGFLDDEAGKTLNEILEKAEQDFPEPQTSTDRSWLILQVKLDLEARGLIKAFVPDYNKRMNLLRTTRLGQKMVRLEKALA